MKLKMETIAKVAGLLEYEAPELRQVVTCLAAQGAAGETYMEGSGNEVFCAGMDDDHSGDYEDISLDD